MKQQDTILEMYHKGFLPGTNSEGFIVMIMIPLYLALLTFATAITGCISCSIQAMAHRNEIIQAYSLLEDDEATWQDEAVAAKWKNSCERDYEKVISTQKVGPYILLVKEMRNKTTGEVLVNRLEFIPIEKADDRES